MVDVLSEDDRTRINEAVKAAESKTSAEIVVMVMRQATDYRTVEILTAAAVALAVPAVLLPFSSIPALTIWVAQLLAFVVLTLVLPRFGAGRLLLGKDRITDDVRAVAQAEFFAHGLRRTSERAAVLVFVALAEHRVELLCDDRASELVEDADWRRIASSLAARMKDGRTVEGLEAAATEIGELLAEHLPQDEGGGTDELPNVITQ